MALAEVRCSARSEALGETAAGTASVVRNWLLIEHAGPWGERPLLDARLPAGLAGTLDRFARSLGIRVLLIRRPDRDVPEAGACFAIRSGPDDPWIERATLGRPADVLQLDLPALARGERPGLERHEEPLFAVCTHGRRDPCCAERGRPLAQRLSVARPGQTWESTHLGGDRFAANLAAFPHGWYFGRVEPDGGPVIADAYAGGRIEIGHARGRTCFPIDVQAAELFLRKELGLDGLEDVELVSLSRRGRSTTVVFGTPAGGLSVRVDRSTGPPRPLTSRATRDLGAPEVSLSRIRPARRTPAGGGAFPPRDLRP